MFSVFISFVSAMTTRSRCSAFALAIAVALDAFVVAWSSCRRSRPCWVANWYLPAWLNKILPAIHVESEEEAAEIIDPSTVGRRSGRPIPAGETGRRVRSSPADRGAGPACWATAPVEPRNRHRASVSGCRIALIRARAVGRGAPGPAGPGW